MDQVQQPAAVVAELPCHQGPQTDKPANWRFTAYVVVEPRPAKQPTETTSTEKASAHDEADDQDWCLLSVSRIDLLQEVAEHVC